MPTYEFKCHRDGSRHTATLTFAQKDGYKPFCEECGASMTQVFNPAGVVFKGSGFYRTDSRPKPKPVEKKETKSETASKASPDIS